MCSNFTFNLQGWPAAALIAVIVFLTLLATNHAETAFAGLSLVATVFVFILLARSGFTNGLLWFIFLTCLSLLLILCTVYVPSEWQSPEKIQRLSGLLSVLFHVA